jgi:hypothetical protein
MYKFIQNNCLFTTISLNVFRMQVMAQAEFVWLLFNVKKAITLAPGA